MNWLKEKEDRLLFIATIAVLIFLYLSIELGVRFGKKQLTIDPWVLVPESSVMVIETPQAHTFFENLDTTSIWQQLYQIPFSQEIQEEFSLLENFFSHVPEYGKALITVSTEGVKSYAFSIIIPVDESPANDITEKVKTLLSESFQEKIQERTYRNQSIWEVKIGEEKTFSFTKVKNHLVGSWDAVMVESSIRQSRNFYPNTHLLKPIESNSSSKVYINNREFPQLFKHIFNERNRSQEWFSQLIKQQSVNFIAEDNKFTIKGTSSLSSSLLFNELIGNQNSTPNHILPLLPTYTTHYFRFSISDSEQFGDDVSDHLYHTTPEIRLTKEKVNALGFDFEAFYEAMGEELAQASFSPKWMNKNYQLTFCKVSQKELMQRTVRRFFDRLQEDKQASYKKYRKHTIYSLNIEELPTVLFGLPFQDYSQVFYTFYKDYLIFGNSLIGLKQWLKDIEYQDKWKHSSLFLKHQSVAPTQFEAGIQIQQAWDDILDILSPEWSTLFEQNKRKLLDIEYISMQLAPESKVQLGIVHHSSNKELLELKKLTKGFTINTQHSIARKPELIENKYLITQDSRNNINCHTATGEFLWKYSLSAPLANGIHSVYSFSKRQDIITFASANKLYAVNAQGKTLQHFPIELPPYFTAKQLACFDPKGQNKLFYLAVSNEYGQVYIYNTSGNAVSGWQPQKLLEPLSEPISYTEGATESYIISCSKDGKISLFDLKGNPNSAFPIQFNMPVDNGIFINEGINNQNTSLTFISKQGTLITLDLNGKIIDRKDYQEILQGYNFSMIKEHNNHSRWIIVAQNKQEVRFISRNGRLLFKLPKMTTKNAEIEFWDYGLGIEILSVTYPDRLLSELYFINGEKVTTTPINNTKGISTHYKQNTKTLSIYASYYRKVIQYQIKL